MYYVFFHVTIIKNLPYFKYFDELTASSIILKFNLIII